jgi:acetolactate synthase-1/3 small subunit
LLFEERKIQNVIKDSNANIVTVTPEFFVLEKTGRRRDVEALYDQLEPYGLMQFVRSGRISITKEKLHISKILENFGMEAV